MLAAGRRRELLGSLDRAGGEAALSEVVRTVAEREGIGPGAPASETKKVYVSLYRTHVHKLADTAVVHYDHESKRVRSTPRAAALFPSWRPPPTVDTSKAGGLLSRLLGHPQAKLSVA
jgi:hypothetical protein